MHSPPPPPAHKFLAVLESLATDRAAFKAAIRSACSWAVVDDLRRIQASDYMTRGYLEDAIARAAVKSVAVVGAYGPAKSMSADAIEDLLMRLIPDPWALGGGGGSLGGGGGSGGTPLTTVVTPNINLFNRDLSRHGGGEARVLAASPRRPVGAERRRDAHAPAQHRRRVQWHTLQRWRVERKRQLANWATMGLAFEVVLERALCVWQRKTLMATHSRSAQVLWALAPWARSIRSPALAAFRRQWHQWVQRYRRAAPHLRRRLQAMSVAHRACKHSA